jgi:hypothetical protein
MFDNLNTWLPGLPSLGGLDFLKGASGHEPMQVQHFVKGQPPTTNPYMPEVKVVASNEGFFFKNPAGGLKLFAGLGADLARVERGIKVASATGVSAGSLQSVIQTNDHVHPKEAAQAMLEVLRELQAMDKGSVTRDSTVPCDPLLLYLSGFTSVSPRFCYQLIIDKLKLTWNSRIRILTCAVEIDPSKPGSLTPWTLTNYRHWPMVIDENSGIELADALWMSGAVPGMFVSPELGKSERGYRMIAVDGAYINRIPNISGDPPSIAMSYTRATKMPRELTEDMPRDWLSLWTPANMFDTRYFERVTQFWTKAAQYWNPIKMAGLYQHWVEINYQICGNHNVQSPIDFHIVLGLRDFAAMNIGASEESMWRMFEHGHQTAERRYQEGFESGQLVIPN